MSAVDDCGSGSQLTLSWVAEDICGTNVLRHAGTMLFMPPSNSICQSCRSVRTIAGNVPVIVLEVYRPYHRRTLETALYRQVLVGVDLQSLGIMTQSILECCNRRSYDNLRSRCISLERSLCHDLPNRCEFSCCKEDSRACSLVRYT